METNFANAAAPRPLEDTRKVVPLRNHQAEWPGIEKGGQIHQVEVLAGLNPGECFIEIRADEREMLALQRDLPSEGPFHPVRGLPLHRQGRGEIHRPFRDLLWRQYLECLPDLEPWQRVADIVSRDRARKVRVYVPRSLRAVDTHRDRLEVEHSVRSLGFNLQVRCSEATGHDLSAGEFPREGKVLQYARALPMCKMQTEQSQAAIPDLEP